MPEYISIQIPKEVLSAARISPDQLKLELAIALYQQDIKTLNDLGE